MPKSKLRSPRSLQSHSRERKPPQRIYLTYISYLRKRQIALGKYWDLSKDNFNLAGGAEGQEPERPILAQLSTSDYTHASDRHSFLCGKPSLKVSPCSLPLTSSCSAPFFLLSLPAAVYILAGELQMWLTVEKGASINSGTNCR